MIKKALHIIMAAMVLISTMGITINMHYCHDQLIDLALYSPAESCCDINSEAPCDTHERLSKMNHCNDESIILEALEDFVVSSLTFDFENQESTDLLHWISLQYSIQDIYDNVESDVPQYYLPPPYQEVELSQIQTYLI